MGVSPGNPQVSGTFKPHKERRYILRLRRLAVTGLFALLAAASAASLDHMDSLPALLLIAPGYLVQAWLFVRHRALGGLGYDLTIIGTSAIFWTLLFIGVFSAGAYVVRRIVRRQES
jgi:hypothetical protein